MLAHAQEVKQQSVRRLMRENPAIFGVGVGQSLDNPREAALVLYVDRNKLPANLPLAVSGLRTAPLPWTGCTSRALTRWLVRRATARRT